MVKVVENSPTIRIWPLMDKKRMSLWDLEILNTEIGAEPGHGTEVTPWDTSGHVDTLGWQSSKWWLWPATGSWIQDSNLKWAVTWTVWTVTQLKWLRVKIARLAGQSLSWGDPCPSAKAPAHSASTHRSWREHEKYNWIEPIFYDSEIIPVSEKVLSARKAVSD